MSTEILASSQQIRVDLHSHTKCSDGELTPQELIERAVGFQIDMLAITDHDTVEGYHIASRYIKEKNYPIDLVAGIEISTQWQGFEIHVVGLNIDVNSSSLQALITSQQSKRNERAIAISEKLAKSGFDNMLAKARELAQDGAITRNHFARVLLHQGVVSKMQPAFDKYLGKGKRAYVKPLWCDIETAVAVIKEAGGISVLAHPIRYDLSPKWRRRLIEHFKSAGGESLEVVLPQMNNDQRMQMLNYCDEYQFYASAGSDFHTANNRWSDLGRNLKLPDKCQPVWQLWQSTESKI